MQAERTFWRVLPRRPQCVLRCPRQASCAHSPRPGIKAGGGQQRWSDGARAWSATDSCPHARPSKALVCLIPSEEHPPPGLHACSHRRSPKARPHPLTPPPIGMPPSLSTWRDVGNARHLRRRRRASSAAALSRGPYRDCSQLEARAGPQTAATSLSKMAAASAPSARSRARNLLQCALRAPAPARGVLKKDGQRRLVAERPRWLLKG